MEFGVKLIHHQTFAIVQRIYDRICQGEIFDGSLGFVSVKRKGYIMGRFSFIIVLTMAAYDAVVNLGYVVYAQIRIFGETNYTLTQTAVVSLNWAAVERRSALPRTIFLLTKSCINGLLA